MWYRAINGISNEVYPNLLSHTHSHLYLSPPSALTPDQASPYSILHRIRSIHLRSRYCAPIHLPAPPLPSQPLSDSSLQRNSQLFTIAPLHYDDPPVTHTSPRTPYDPSYDEYRSPSHVLMIDTSIAHRRSPPFLGPPSSPTPYLPARTGHLRALSHQTRPRLIAYSIGSAPSISEADIAHPYTLPHLPSCPPRPPPGSSET